MLMIALIALVLGLATVVPICLVLETKSRS